MKVMHQVANRVISFVFTINIYDMALIVKWYVTLTGDILFESAYNDIILNKRGGVTMCDIVQGFVNEGREEGKEELIRKMLETKFATEQQIADLLKISVEEVKKIAAKVPVKA